MADITGLTTTKIVAMTTGALGAFSDAEISALSTAQLAALRTSQLVTLTESQISALGVDQLRSLGTAKLDVLLTLQIAALTANQVVGLTTAQIKALKSTNVVSLRSIQIGALGAEQIAVLGASSMAALQSSQMIALTSLQVGALSSGQLRAISVSALGGLNDLAVMALNKTQVAALLSDQLNLLGITPPNLPTGISNGQSESKLSLLTTAQTSAFGTSQVAAMTTGTLNSLTTAHFASMLGLQVSAMTTRQIAALEIADLAAFTTLSISAFKATQIAAINVADVGNLGLAQLAALNTQQLVAMSTRQIAGIVRIANPIAQGVSAVPFTFLQIAALTSAQINGLGAEALMYGFSTYQLSVLATSQIRALSANSVKGLTQDQLVALAPAQFAAISTTGVAAMSQEQMVALTTAESAALTTAQISNLAEAQIIAMESADFASISAAAIASLRLSQVSALMTTQLASLGAATINALRTNQINSLLTSQVRNLTTRNITALSTSQLSALLKTPEITTPLTTRQAVAISGDARINVLGSSQIVALTSSQVQTLSTTHVSGLSISQLQALTTSQFLVMRTAQIAALTTLQFPNLEAVDFAVLTPSQILALTTRNISLLSAEEIVALTTLQVQAFSTLQIRTISTQGIAYFQTEDVKALKTTQVATLSSAQLLALVPAATWAGNETPIIAVGTMPSPSLGGMNVGITRFANDGSALWNVIDGGGSVEQLTSMSTDANGCVIVTGQSSGGFIRKFDIDGNRMWARQEGAALHSSVVCSDGSIFVSGADAEGVFVCKFSPGGEKLWIQSISESAFSETSFLMLGPESSVYAASNLASDGGVLAKYSDIGLRHWSVPVGTIECMTVLPDGSTVVHGVSALSRIGPNGEKLWSVEGVDSAQLVKSGFDGAIFLCGTNGEFNKYDADGQLVWSIQTDVIKDLAISPDGSLFVCGMRNLNATGGYVSKYDLNGNLKWTSSIPAEKLGSDYLMLDGEGNVSVVGLTSGTQEWPSSSGLGTVIAEFDFEGTCLWTRQIDGQYPWVTADINFYGSSTISGTSTFLPFNTSQIAALTTVAINALGSSRLFNSLSLDQVAALSTSQITSLTTGSITGFDKRQIAALQTGQIVAITTLDLGALSSASLNAFTTRQFAALTTRQIFALSTRQVLNLQTADLVAWSASQIASLSTRNIAVLSAAEMVAMTTPQTVSLRTSQVSALGTQAIAAMRTDQLTALSASQIASLNPSQVGVLAPSNFTALNAAQMGTLRPASIAMLRTSQFAVITTAQVLALFTAQMQAINTAGLMAMQPDAVRAMSSSQINALTTSQLVAIFTPKFDSSNSSFALSGSTYSDINNQKNHGGTDAVIAKYSADGNTLWTSLIGSGGYEYMVGTLGLPDGSVIASGISDQNLNGQMNHGGVDGFLVKIGADGVVVWTRMVGSTAYDQIIGTAVDEDGAIYATGYTDGDIDGQINNGNRRQFLSKYTPTGNLEWTTFVATLGTKGAWDNTIGNCSLRISSNNTIIVSGSNFGDTDEIVNDGITDRFISEYSTAGIRLSTKFTYSGITPDLNIFAFNISKDGTKTTIGYTVDEATGVLHGFLIRADADGALLWKTKLVTSGEDWIASSAAAPDGAVAIVGYTAENIDYDHPQAAGGAFICKYESQGGVAWARMITGTANAVAFGADGSVIVAGVTGDAIDQQTNAGGTDGYVIKYSSDGIKIWTRLIGLSANEQVVSIKTLDDGSIIVGGTTDGNINGQVDTGPQSKFIAKIDDAGELLWTKWLGGTDSVGNLLSNFGSSDELAIIDVAQPNAFSSKQIAVLTSNQIETLASSNLIYTLSTSQISALSVKQISLLSGKSLNAFTAAQFGVWATDQIASISSRAIATLAPTNLASLTTKQINALTTAQLFSLTGEQLSQLGEKSFFAMRTAAITSLNTKSFNSLSTAQVKALSTAQVRAVSTAQLRALASQTVAAMESDDIRALSNAQVAALSTSQVVSLIGPQALGYEQKTTVFNGASVLISNHQTANPASSQSNQRYGIVEKYAANGELLWSRTVSSSENVFVGGAVLCSDGTVIVRGSTTGGFDDQGYVGGYDGYIRKYSADGALLWTRMVATNNSDYIYAMSVQADGSIRITAESWVSEQSPEWTVAAYTAQGEALWKRSLGKGSTYFSNLTGLTATSDIVVNGGNSVSKWNRDGVQLWQNDIQGEVGIDQVYIGLDGSVQVIATGTPTVDTQWTIDGQSTYLSSGGRDLFLFKYALDGTKLWTKVLGSVGDDTYISSAIGHDGSIVILGDTLEYNTFEHDLFIAKYGADGTLLWKNWFGTRQSEEAYSNQSLYVSPDGLILVAGTTYGNLDGGNDRRLGISVSGESERFGFITKFDADGTKLWTNLSEVGTSMSRVVAAPDGSFVTVDQSDSAKYQYKTYTSITRYSATGEKLWSQQLIQIQSYVNEINIDVNGDITVIGQFPSGDNNNTPPTFFQTKYSKSGLLISEYFYASSAESYASYVTELKSVASGAYSPKLQLTTGQTYALGTAQIAALSDTKLYGFSTDQILALSASQIQTFLPKSIEALSTAQFEVLLTNQLRALGPAQLTSVTAAQLSVLTGSKLFSMLATQIAALSTGQIVCLSTAQISSLGTAQVVALTTAQVSNLEAADFAALGAAQVAVLSTADIAALNTAEMVAMTTAQVQLLSIAQVQAISTRSVIAMESVDLQALKTLQVGALSTASIVALAAQGTAPIIESGARETPVTESPSDGPSLSGGTLLQVVNLSSTSNSGWLDGRCALGMTTLTLESGTYRVQYVQKNELPSATYDAWGPWGGGNNVWGPSYSVKSDNGYIVRLWEVDDMANSLDAAIQLGHSRISTFNLTSPGKVDFFISDTYVPDNAGGVSLAIYKINSDALDNRGPQLASFSRPTDAIPSPWYKPGQMVLTFSEAIQRGVGSVALRDIGGNLVATYDVADVGHLRVIGNKLYFDSTVGLNDGKDYVVEFEQSAIKDLSGNSLAGNTKYALGYSSAAIPISIDSVSTGIAFANLTTTQVSALSAQQLNALGALNRLGAMTATQLVAMTTAQVVALNTVSVNALTTLQLLAVKPAQLSALTATQVASLNSLNLNVLTTQQFTFFTSAQISALTTAQVMGLETADFASLGVSQIVAVSSAAIAVLSTAEIVAITTLQIQALTASQFQALSSQGIAALQSDDLLALKTSQVTALTTLQVAVLASSKSVVLDGLISGENNLPDGFTYTPAKGIGNQVQVNVLNPFYVDETNNVVIVTFNNIKTPFRLPVGSYELPDFLRELQSGFNNLTNTAVATSSGNGGLTVSFDPLESRFVFISNNMGPEATIAVEGSAVWGFESIFAVGTAKGPAVIQSLSASQVASLTSASLNVLGLTGLLNALGTNQIAALATQQIIALKTISVNSLSSIQLKSLRQGQLAALGTAQVVSLRTDKLGAFTTQQILALGTAQIAALSTAQIHNFETADFAVLGATQIAALSSAAIAQLSSAGMMAITTAQIRALGTAQLVAITALDISVLQSDDVQSLLTAQVGALTTAQMVALVGGLKRSTDFSVILAGSTTGNLNGQASQGGTDAFVAKFNSDGNLIWSQLQSTAGDESARGAVAGLDGSVYVSGNTNSELDGQSYNGGSSDGYLSKFSSDGTPLWTKLIGTSSDDAVISPPVLSSDGAIYVAGRSYGSLDGNVSRGDADIFVTKFSPDGSKVWTHTLGTPAQEYPFAITSDLNGAVFVSGVTQGALDATGYAGGLWDGFVAKIQPDGTVSWIRGVGTNGMDSSDVVRAALDGSIYVAGGIGGTLNGQPFLGGRTWNGWPPDEEADAYLIKYDSQGNVLWTKTWGTASYDRATDMAIGTDGNIYIVGDTGGNLDGTSNTGPTSFFVTSFKSDGSKIGTALFGNPTMLWGPRIGFGPDGKLYISATTPGINGYDVNGVVGLGSSDVVFAQLNIDGTVNWTKLFGTNQSDGIGGLSIQLGVTGTPTTLALSSSQVAALSSAHLNALGGENLIQRFGTELIRALTAGQISGLTTQAFAVTRPEQIGALGVSQFAGISTLNISILSTAQTVAITTAQVQALSIPQIQALTVSNWSAIESQDLLAMTTNQVAALSTAQLIALMAPTTYADASVIVAGETSGDFFGQSNLGGADAFVTKYDASGNPIWTRLLGTSQDDWVVSTITNKDSTILVSGNTYGALDGQVSKGNGDGFVSKLLPDGSRAWSRVVGTDQYDQINVSARGQDGSVILGGETLGGLDGESNHGGLDGFISKFDTNGNKVWTRQMGSEQSDAVLDVSASIGGTFFVGGYTSGGLDEEVYQGLGDGFISKYAVDGSLQWTRLVGTSQRDWIKVTQALADGSVIVGGNTFGDLGGKSNQGGGDGFICKYDGSGNLVWTTLVGSSYGDTVLAVTTTSDGSILVAGTTGGYLNGQINQGNEDGFISKYDPNGSLVWTRLTGTSQNDQINAITTSTDGSILVSGFTNGALGGENAQGSGDAFVCKYDAQGTLQWTRLGGSDESDAAYTIESGLGVRTKPLAFSASQLVALSSAQLGALGRMNLLVALQTDQIANLATSQINSLSANATNSLGTAQIAALQSPQVAALATMQIAQLSPAQVSALVKSRSESPGSILVTGYTRGNFASVPNAGGNDVFVSKVDGNGTTMWTNVVGSSGDDQPRGVISMPDGSIFSVGLTNGNLDGKVNIGAYDGYISKFSSDGIRLWTQLVGTSATDFITGITPTADGSIVVVGITNGDISTMGAYGNSDIFVTKFTSDGARIWTTVVGGSSEDVGYNITAAQDGSIYLTGATYGVVGGNTNLGKDDALLAKLDASGSVSWVRTVATSGYDNFWAANSSTDGFVYAVGQVGDSYAGQSFKGGLNWDRWPSDMQSDAILVKYDLSGNQIWSKTFGTSAADCAKSLSFADDGTIMVAGLTGGNLDGKIAGSPTTVFISRFQPDGTSLGSSFFANGSMAWSPKIVSGQNGKFYIAGDIPPANNKPVNGIAGFGLEDAYIAQLSSDGSTDWTKILGTIQGDGIYGISYSNASASTIPFSTIQTAALSNEALNSINVLNSLSANQLNALTTLQISAISPSNIGDLGPLRFGYFSTNQVAALSSTQLKGMSGTGFQSISLKNIAAISSSGIGGLNSDVLAALTTAQILALSTLQLAALTASQVAALSTADIVVMTTAQISGFPAVNFGLLSTTQLQALTTGQIGSLLSTHISTLEPKSFSAFRTDQISALTAFQIPYLSSDDLTALNTGQILAFNPTSVRSFGSDQLSIFFKPGNRLVWSRSGPGIDGDIATGPDGSIYGVGSSFVKYSSGGQLIWSQTLTTGARNLAVAQDGFVAVTGRTVGDLFGEKSNGVSDPFVSKYGPDGTRLWTRLIGTSAIGNEGGNSGQTVAFGNDGSVYVGGSEWGAIANTTPLGRSDGFVTKFDANGVMQWTKILGGYWYDGVNALSANSDGSVAVAGTNNAGSGGFLVKLDAAGKALWSVNTGGREAFAVASASDGSIYVGGMTNYSMGGQKITPSMNSGDSFSGYDAFLSKYDFNGNLVWTRFVGTGGYDSGMNLDVGKDGMVYLHGFLGATLDNQPTSSLGVFVSKFDPSGNNLFTFKYGDAWHGQAIADNGDIYLDNGNTLTRISVSSDSSSIAQKSGQLNLSSNASAACALGTSQIAALTTAQILSLNSAAVTALNSSQVAALSTADLVVMTTAQLSYLSSGLSIAQMAVLTVPQKAAYIATPIMLDLNGDGVQTLGLGAGVQFDVRANGVAMQTGWVSAQDGLLVMDRNGDGSINDGSELFGSSTRLSDGTRARDGYQALSALDANADGMISSQDDAFSKMRVWVDADSDGLSSAKELFTLDSLGISILHTQALAIDRVNNGNVLGLLSSYETTDGQSHQAADVWFGAAVEQAVPISEQVTTLTQALGEFSQARAAPSARICADPDLEQWSSRHIYSASQSLVAAMQSYHKQSLLPQAVTGADTLAKTTDKHAMMAAQVESIAHLGAMRPAFDDAQQLFPLATRR